eukprot:4432065-Pyramimonas_sp.AAC.1
MFVGPGATLQDSWKGPCEKYQSRAKAIGQGVQATSVSGVLYQTRVVPALSYVAQSPPPPRRLFDLDLGALASAFRIPIGTFSTVAWHFLREWNGPKVNALLTPVSYTHLRAHETGAYL